MKPPKRPPAARAASTPAKLLITTDSLRTLLPEVFYRNPMPSAVNELSDAARYIEVNDAWLAFFGLERDQVLGKSLREIQIWASDEQRQRLREQLQKNPHLRDMTAVARRGDGSAADILASAEPFEHNGRDCVLWVFTDVTERVRAERQLRQSEERFARIFSHSPLAMSVAHKADGVFGQINRAYESLLGYQHEELAGLSALDAGLWVDPGARARLLGGLDAEHRSASIETQLRKKDGTLIDVMFIVAPIEVDGAEMLHATLIDMSEVRRVTRQKAESEARFEKIFDTSPDAIAVARIADGVHLEVNRAWLDLYGLVRSGVIGRSSHAFGVWQEPEERNRIVAELKEHGSIRGFEVRQRHSSGAAIEVLISAQPVDWNGEAALLSCAIDITAQKRAERERAGSEARFAKVFQAGPHPIVFSRAADGLDIRVNDAWLHLFGYSAAEVQGQSSVGLNLWVDPDFRGQRKKILARGEQMREVETQMRAKSGAIIDVQISSESFDLDGVAYLVSMITDVTARKLAARQIEFLATRDALTGLPNRLLFADRLRQALAKAARAGGAVALMFIDLDHFKNINDTLGHEAGDQVLTEVAARLTAVLRDSDTLARQGGDEFLLLIEGLAAAGEAGPVADKLLAALAPPVRYKDAELKVACSIGISIYPDDATEVADLQRNADLAMYAAKDAGRSAYRFFTAGMNQRLVEKMSIEARLRGALERGEFVLHFQPKVEFASGRVSGCEALLRWRQADGAMLLPGRFIGIAEESGLIVALGAWVLRETCVTLKRWLDAGLAPVPVACNLSVHQFNSALPQQIAALLQETGVPGRLLQLEITESVMMNNPAAHLDTMRQLYALGVEIALDDFGTGYSSLSYLRHMHLDVLKIDRAFVRDVATDADARAITAAIIAMAVQFGLKTVAEGVETPEQAEALRAMQCGEYQGFLFSPALPAPEFEAAYLITA